MTQEMRSMINRTLSSMTAMQLNPKIPRF